MRHLLLVAIYFSSLIAKSQTDTLFNFFQENGATLIESPNGGYVSGTNGYGDSEKLQAFYPLKSESVLGAFIWFGAKTFNSLDAQSRLCLKVKNIDTTQTNTAPFFRGITNTIDSSWIALSAADTGLTFPSGLQYFSFDSPVLVNGFYAIGLNFDSLSRDTLGNLIDSVAIFNSAKDSVSSFGLSWEKWNGNYKRIIDTWGFDVDFAIFPVIDSTLNAVNFLNAEQLTVFPNPCSHSFRINLPLQTKPVNMSLMSLDGRVLLETKLAENQAFYEIDTSNFPDGYYFLKLQNNIWLGFSSFVIAHK